MNETIEARIAECSTKAQKYEKWLSLLKVPNFLLVGIGSLLAFLGGASIIAKGDHADFAGYMALIGGAMTGLHNWLGCEAHQQRCRTIEARYSAFKLKYESLKNLEYNKADERKNKFMALEESYAEFVESIDTKPWF